MKILDFRIRTKHGKNRKQKTENRNRKQKTENRNINENMGL